MLLALILKCKEMVAKDNGEGNNAHGPTLVVVPLSLISQWEEEILTKTSLTLRICYGDQTKDKSGDFNFDIVLTTWGTMQAEFQKVKKNTPNRSYGLLDQNWLRVILDEAHAIKNQSTVVSKAACAVKSRYRWVVTGTIIHNSLDDVYGLIKFLQHQPWCEPAFWNAAISSEMKRAEKSKSGDLDEAEEPTGMMVALERVRRLLGPMMLRRTKDSLTSDG
jgi:SNF2 family DNA or RNA helicase